jgi:hypothetical protein
LVGTLHLKSIDHNESISMPWWPSENMAYPQPLIEAEALSRILYAKTSQFSH